VQSLFRSRLGDSTSDRFEDADFDIISQFLKQVGKLSWSVRPRTYAVLRLIGQVDLLDDFVDDGLTDIALSTVRCESATRGAQELNSRR
jgi:hypothetical protein